MSVPVTKTKQQKRLVVKLKTPRTKEPQKIYKQGEYMTNQEKRDWYIANVKNDGKKSPSVLMPDGTYYWLLSNKDMYDECFIIHS